MILKNIDELFELDTEFAAVQNFNSPFTKAPEQKALFNSGLLILKPSLKTFKSLLQQFSVVESYNGGDQGFLNAIFNNWTPLPLTYNVNKMMLKYAKDLIPKDMKVIHFVRHKPWYDVQFQSETNYKTENRDSASDYKEFNQLWFRVYAYLNLKVNQTRPAYETVCYNTTNDQNECVRVVKDFCPFLFECFQYKREKEIKLSTQMSFDRMSRLESLIQEWHGPLSIALWIPNMNFTETIRQLLLINLPWHRTQLHLVIQKEPTSYPINLLRNIAIENSFHDLLFLADIDFIPQPGLYRQLITSHHYQHVWDNSKLKHLFVVPAFEWTFNNSSVKLRIPANKNELLEAIERNEIQVFHESVGKGHLATNFTYWREAKKPYYTLWQNWYEPYLIMRKEPGVKYFNEQFTGI